MDVAYMYYRARGRSSFCWLISACIKVAVVFFALIQTSECASPSIAIISVESSVSGKGFCV